MTTPAIVPRSLRLKEWMSEHYIDNQAVAEQLGITRERVREYFNQDWMPVEPHKKCVALGFPVDLLPTPYDMPRVGPASSLIFPGWPRRTMPAPKHP